jgi:hypothetical protein
MNSPTSFEGKFPSQGDVNAEEYIIYYIEKYIIYKDGGWLRIY